MAAVARTEQEPTEQAVAAVPVASSVAPATTSVAGVRALQRAIGNRATGRVLTGRRALARRSAHSDKDLFDVMQAFRKKNDHLSEAEQNKIFWSIKKATDSDEVAWRFFDYYSGWTGSKIKKWEGKELEAMRAKTFLAQTKPDGDTFIDPDFLLKPEETLGPLLLHEFAHTAHHTNVGGNYDFEEGQAYAVEYFYAEHTGDSGRTTRIINIISTAGARWGKNQEAAAKENFRVSYVLLKELANLTSTGSSTLPGLVGKSATDGRLMSADFVSGFRSLSTDLQALWDHIKKNLSSFTFPSV